MISDSRLKIVDWRKGALVALLLLLFAVPARAMFEENESGYHRPCRGRHYRGYQAGYERGYRGRCQNGYRGAYHGGYGSPPNRWGTGRAEWENCTFFRAKADKSMRAMT